MVLLVSVFFISVVSAFSIGDFWNKITGKVISSPLEFCGTANISDCVYEDKYNECNIKYVNTCIKIKIIIP